MLDSNTVVFDKSDSGILLHNKDVIMCIHFPCDLKCTDCWIDGFRTKLKPLTFDEFKLKIDDIVKNNQFNRVILSGGEVTLKKDIANYVRYARQYPSIKHVRIQTHGRHLRDKEFCQKLIDAGIDEYYVSLHGPNAQMHEEITLIPGSFNQTLAGMRTITELNASIWIATVVSNRNYKHLPDIVKLVDPFKVKELHFLNYVSVHLNDPKDLSAKHLDVSPYLQKTIDLVKKKNITPVVKYFPKCLLGEHKDCLYNETPILIIDPYFDKMNQDLSARSCPFRSVCPSEDCWGIALSQQEKYGVDGYSPFALRHMIVEPATLPSTNARKKYIFHNELFNLEHPFLPLLYALLNKTNDYKLFLSVYYDKDKIKNSGGQFVLLHKKTSDKIANVLEFLKLVKMCPEIQLDTSLLRMLSEYKITNSNIIDVRLTIDLCENLENSSVKALFAFNDFSIGQQVIQQFNSEKLFKSPRPYCYTLEFEMQFSGRSNSRIFYSYLRNQYPEGDFPLSIKENFDDKICPFLDVSEVVNIGFKHNSEDPLFAFQISNPERLVELVGHAGLTSFRAQLRQLSQNTEDIGKFAILESKIANGQYDNFGVLY